jgi:hypothetical protein
MPLKFGTTPAMNRGSLEKYNLKNSLWIRKISETKAKFSGIEQKGNNSVRVIFK